MAVSTNAPRTFPITTPETSGSAFASYNNGRGLTWNGTTGTLTLTTLTMTGASGTFSFTATSTDQGTQVVTNGVFNVTF